MKVDLAGLGELTQQTVKATLIRDFIICRVQTGSESILSDGHGGIFTNR
jgi:hypothetical protein